MSDCIIEYEPTDDMGEQAEMLSDPDYRDMMAMRVVDQVSNPASDEYDAMELMQ